MKAEADYRLLIADLEANLKVLPDKPDENPETTLRALWFTACGNPCTPESANDGTPLPPLDSATRARLKELVRSRLHGTPLAHLTGLQRFMGIDFLAGPGALIPRKETEILGTAALEHLRACCDERGSAVALDVCTGSGNLALTLGHFEPRCDVYGVDLSEEAVELARKNAEHLGLSDRVRFRAGDLFAPYEEELAGKIDLLTCNPPYISSAKVEHMPDEISKHEPEMAFNGGPFGIAILNKLIKGAPKLLRSKSWLCFELGHGQGPAMKKRLEKSNQFSEIQSYEDAKGEIRVLAARTP